MYLPSHAVRLLCVLVQVFHKLSALVFPAVLDILPCYTCETLRRVTGHARAISRIFIFCGPADYPAARSFWNQRNRQNLFTNFGSHVLVP